MAELAYAAGLGPVGLRGPWRFESSRPHSKPAFHGPLPWDQRGMSLAALFVVTLGSLAAALAAIVYGLAHR